MEPVKNYFITMVGETYKECVGYYPKLETAAEQVQNNAMDINDGGIYKYAMIEEISIGIYPDVDKRWWFVFDVATRKYIPCSTPEKYIFKPTYPDNPFPYSFK